MAEQATTTSPASGDAVSKLHPKAIRTGWVVNVMIALATFLTLIAAMVTMSRYAIRLHWSLELFTHWPVITALGTLLPLLMLAGLKRWKWAIFPLVVVMWNLALILPLYWPASRPASDQPLLRVMSANIHSGNRERERFVSLVQQESPDVLVVMEINERWQTAMGALDEIYPYRIYEPRRDNFGIAMLSKYPFTSQSVEQVGDSSIPAIFATLAFDGQLLHVIAVHTLPPMNENFTIARNSHLDALASRISQLQGSVLLLGDLNTTSWSPVFGKFLHESQLSDSRTGFGIQASWPVEGDMLRIPIDHALISQDLLVSDRRLAPDIGSDHLPIVVEVGRRK